MFRFVFAMIFVIGCFAMFGCGGSTTTNPVAVDETKSEMDDVKSSLLKIAETGEGGSAVEDIRRIVDKKASEGDAKAKEILPDVSALMNLTDSAAIKKKAKEIADKI